MTEVKKIYEALNELAPFDTQEDWDNSGILVGSDRRVVSSVMLCLDITKEAAEEAAEKNIGLVISHHPVIFKGLKELDDGNPAVILSKNNISAICMHTNFDKCRGGMNDILCRALGLVPVGGEVLSDKDNIGRVCVLPEELSVSELAETAKRALGCRSVRFNGGKRKIKKVGVCSGSGGDYIYDAVKKNCGALLTGDVSHHDFIDAQNMGLSVIDAGHFYTENIFYNDLKTYLKQHFPELLICESENNRSIVREI